MKEKYISCQCGQEVLRVERLDDNEWWLSIYERYPYSRTLMSRLRLAWNVVRHGEFYKDQMCLDDESMKELVEYVNECNVKTA